MMKRVKSNSLKKILSVVLSVAMLSSVMNGCGTSSPSNINDGSNDSLPNIDTTAIANGITEQIQEENEAINTKDGIDYDYFVYQKIFDEFSIAFDTFDAVLKMPDGSEIYGIGYSDFSAYFEPDDGSRGYFPAGFIVAGGEFEILDSDIEKGLEIENLSYYDDNYGFVLAYGNDPYSEHCVLGGKYVQYGINDKGSLYHTECDYDRDKVDTGLGSLYSYDDNRYLYDTGVGEYATISGTSLFSDIDYEALEAEINRVLDEQDANGCSVDVETAAYFAQEAVYTYLLSIQEETFLGCNVDELIVAVSNLDPMQCIRITPDGNVIVNVDNDIPNEPSALAKWVVGISCGIAVAGSVALGVFVPAATPASGAICGAAIDVFMQVVVQNQAVENIDWRKVAVSATAGALMAWACPLGASAITESLATRTGSQVLAKLAGYGFLTISNAVVSGATNATYTYIDGGSEDEIFDSFLIGAALGAGCTIAASALCEVGHVAMNALKNSHPENWFVRLTDGASTFIANHQVHLNNSTIEGILAPKSVYEACQTGIAEYNRQLALTSGRLGGSYNDVKISSNGEFTEVHETPSFSSTGATGSRSEANGPSIKLSREDHRLTASWGNSNEAREYRAAQEALINEGRYQEAIQMDIDDLHLKFGDKYDEGISQMIEYAQQIGWWPS